MFIMRFGLVTPWMPPGGQFPFERLEIDNCRSQEANLPHQARCYRKQVWRGDGSPIVEQFHKSHHKQGDKRWWSNNINVPNALIHDEPCGIDILHPMLKHFDRHGNR